MSYLVSFLQEAYGKKPARVTLLLPPARAPLQKTPTASTSPASVSSTLTQVLQATSVPVIREEDPTPHD